MLKIFKINKQIISTFLVGILTFLISSQSFAQSAGVQKVQDDTVNTTLSTTILGALNKIILINKTIQNKFEDIYNDLETNQNDNKEYVKYFLNAGNMKTNENYLSDSNNLNSTLTNKQDSTNTDKTSKNTDDFSASANSLLSGYQYNINPKDVQQLLTEKDKDKQDFNKKNQAEAALAFLKNTASVTKGVVEPTKDDAKLGDKDIQSYVDYVNTIKATQSIANNTLVNSFVNRLPYQIDKDTIISKLKNRNEMNTKDVEDKNYWDKGRGSKPLLQRMIYFITSFHSININLENIQKQLELMNVQLAAVISQNNIVIKNSVGMRLYQVYNSKIQSKIKSQVKFKQPEQTKTPQQPFQGVAPIITP